MPNKQLVEKNCKKQGGNKNNFLLRSNSFNGILLVPEIFCINGRTFDVLFDIYLTHGNEVHKFSVQQSAILIACCIWDGTLDFCHFRRESLAVS